MLENTSALQSLHGAQIAFSYQLNLLIKLNTVDRQTYMHS